MTNDNEQPEANHEQPTNPVYGPEPAPAVPEVATPPPAPVTSAPVAERHRWRPTRGVVTVAAAAVAGVVLFGSGFAVGHAVDGGDHHRPRLMRDAGPRDMSDEERRVPMDRQMPQRDGGRQMPEMPGRR